MIALRRPAAAFATVSTLVAESAVIALLTTLGSRPEFRVPFGRLDGWLRATPPADALVAALRWLALVAAWWLLGSTLLYVAAVAARVPGAVRAVRWAALPPVRRAVDTAFAVAVVTASLVVPSTAARAAPPPSTTQVRDGRAGGLASLPAAGVPPPGAPAPAAPPAVDARVVVAPGDSLWELAARQLASASGRARTDVADAEIAPYWVAVCDRNRATLASGDPDLLFPGEVVTMPRVS